MAAVKKTTAKSAVKTATAVKTTAPKAEEKAEAKKVETATSAPVKVETEKPAEKAEKKEAAPAAAVKAVEKKKPGRKPGASVKKAELKTALHVQFSGKSYSQSDLVDMAKDVWKYDLKQKATALTSVELYVKPEENMVYYVMNKEFTGSFYI